MLLQNPIQSVYTIHVCHDMVAEGCLDEVKLLLSAEVVPNAKACMFTKLSRLFTSQLFTAL